MTPQEEKKAQRFTLRAIFLFLALSIAATAGFACKGAAALLGPDWIRWILFGQ